jgi:hypothetical protein
MGLGLTCGVNINININTGRPSTSDNNVLFVCSSSTYIQKKAGKEAGWLSKENKIIGRLRHSGTRTRSRNAVRCGLVYRIVSTRETLTSNPFMQIVNNGSNGRIKTDHTLVARSVRTLHLLRSVNGISMISQRRSQEAPKKHLTNTKPFASISERQWQCPCSIDSNITKRSLAD